MKKHVLLIKTSKYVSVQSFLVGRVRFANIEDNPIYLSNDFPPKDLGRAIGMKLEESREISEKEFIYYWENDELFSSFQEKINKELINSYGYKSYRDICKDSLFLSVSIYNSILFITPSHQDGLGTFGTVKDKSGKGIEFEYPIGLSDEELGKAVMEAFTYCTSIYKKK